MTDTRSPASKGCMSWRVGTPTPARMWHSSSASIGTPSVAGWRAMRPEAWTPCWRHTSPRVSPSRSRRQSSPVLDTPSTAQKDSPPMRPCANGCDRRTGWSSRPNTLDTLVRVRFKAKLKVARPSHTKKA